jgi:hypothetical protein
VQFEDPKATLIGTIFLVVLNLVLGLVIWAMVATKPFLTRACLQTRSKQRAMLYVSLFVWVLAAAMALLFGTWTVQGYSQRFKVDLRCVVDATSPDTAVFDAETNKLHTSIDAYAMWFILMIIVGVVLSIGVLVAFFTLRGGLRALSFEALVLQWYCEPLEASKSGHRVAPQGLYEAAFDESELMPTPYDDETRWSQQPLYGNLRNLISPSPREVVRIRLDANHVDQQLFPGWSYTPTRDVDPAMYTKHGIGMVASMLQSLRTTVCPARLVAASPTARQPGCLVGGSGLSNCPIDPTEHVSVDAAIGTILFALKCSALHTSEDNAQLHASINSMCRPLSASASYA